MSNRRYVLIVAAFAATVPLMACIGTTKHATTSGRPEVTIPGKVAKGALAEITNAMVNIGYVPKSRSEMTAIFDKELDRAESFLVGGVDQNRPVRRVTYDIVEGDSNTRILASYAIVTDPGGKRERSTLVNDTNESVEWQQLLDRVKAKLERK